MDEYCHAPSNVVNCYLCIFIRGHCKKSEEIREAVQLKSFDNCLEIDSKCDECIQQQSCNLLKELLLKKE
jgi:hypothetical protein